MKIHTQSAFLSDHCDRQISVPTKDRRAKCRQRQRQLHHQSLSTKIQRKTSLYISAAEDLIATTASVTATTRSSTLDLVIPTANFDTSSTFEPVVFEPILNVPALVIFVLITTVFSALILRTNQVEDAVQTRKLRQEDVRSLKAKELGEGTVSPEKIQQVLQLYEDAVRQEEKLRNILPGVRIVPPSSGNRKEEEAQAIAKQYLGKDFNIGVPKRYNEKSESSGKLPSIAIGILAVIALSLVGLLAFLSFGADPMSGNGGALM